MKQRKFSKTGLVLVGSMLICLLICLAVVIPKGGFGGDSAEDLNDAATPDLKTVMNEGQPLLIADKRPEAQALIAAYEAGQIENVLIGWTGEVMGDEAIDQAAVPNMSAEISAPSEVKELYRLLKNVVVTGEATADEADQLLGEAAADEADDPGDDEEEINLTFELADGTICPYTLIGDSALVIDDVTADGPETETAGINVYHITGAEPLIKEIKKHR